MMRRNLLKTLISSAILATLMFMTCGAAPCSTFAQSIDGFDVTTIGGVAGDLSPSREAFTFKQPPKVLPKVTGQNHVMVAIKMKVRFTGKKALIRSAPKPFSVSITTSYFEVEVLEGKQKGQIVWMNFYDLDKVPKEIKDSKPISEPD